MDGDEEVLFEQFKQGYYLIAKHWVLIAKH